MWEETRRSGIPVRRVLCSPRKKGGDVPPSPTANPLDLEGDGRWQLRVGSHTRHRHGVPLKVLAKLRCEQHGWAQTRGLHMLLPPCVHTQWREALVLRSSRRQHVREAPVGIPVQRVAGWEAGAANTQTRLEEDGGRPPAHQEGRTHRGRTAAAERGQKKKKRQLADVTDPPPSCLHISPAPGPECLAEPPHCSERTQAAGVRRGADSLGPCCSRPRRPERAD